MTEAAASRPQDATRPPGEAPAAASPLNPRELNPREGLGAMPLPTVPVPAEPVAHDVLVRGSLPRTIAALAGPAIASMLLMTVFSTTDAFWVGRVVGPAGLAAVSTSIFWIWMLLSAADMIDVGLTAVASRRQGERRPRAAARAVGDAVVFACVLGAAVGAAGLASLDALFGLMHTPPDVTALGKRYLGSYLLGAPFLFGFFAVDAAFRAAGDTRTPFRLLGVTVLAALVLDPVLILGVGPAPRLGIAGAAVATVFTRGVAFLLGLGILVRRQLILVGAVAPATIASIVRVGLPSAITGIVFSTIYVLLTRIATRFGTPALAALGIGHRVESWTYMIGVGCGVATAAIVGQSLGAHDVRRAERAGWTATGFATAVGVAGSIIELAFAHQLAALFTTDPAVIAEGALYLRIAAISLTASGAELVLEGALGGSGTTLPPMLSSTALTALRIPLATWAASRWGTAGIWWVISLTAAGRGIAMMLLWRSGIWKRKSV
jgi:putative MATE family efflux protein